MRQYGLIGFPLSHSFSKKYFTEKFLKEQIDNCSYELYPLSSVNELPGLLEEHPNLAGLNVTIPYKEVVVPFLTACSAAVQETGACNCIKIQDGKLLGFNTDVIGFEQTLVPLLQQHHRQALILGTGGAAKAVAWVCKKNGIPVQYVSRTKGEQTIGYEDLTKELLERYPIIINTTPLGMQPNVDAMPSVNFEWVSNRHLCIDLIYNPAKTRFLTLAEQAGATIENGMRMLVIQAEESWKIWNSPDTTLVQ
jgi:shikimate dehydrogenase